VTLEALVVFLIGQFFAHHLDAFAGMGLLGIGVIAIIRVFMTFLAGFGADRGFFLGGNSLDRTCQGCESHEPGEDGDNASTIQSFQNHESSPH
jgi:hypothetical protein